MTLDSSGLADYEWLVGAEADGALRDLADRTTSAGEEPLVAAAGRLRRHFSAERVHLLLEQVELRRRATDKFAAAERMFFTRLALEQATDQWVACYKAERYRAVGEQGPLADLCCGIGGDLLALAEVGPTVGVDRDPVSTCLAAANARAVLPADLSDRIELQCTDAESFAAGGLAAFHVDPDRRPAGHRTTSMDWSSPDQNAIDGLLAVVPHGAIKLAPAADVPTAWAERCELEWISRDRQCRQQVAWHGALAQSAGRRRATVLSIDGVALRSIAGPPNQPIPFAQELDRHLFEPDPAVLAAHLAGVIAAEHGLSMFAAGVAYLTGPVAIDDPAVACFAIDDVLPLKSKRLAQYVRDRNIGRLEIKKRGVEHDPAVVRKQLRLAGTNEATLILTKLNRKRVAIFAKRAPHHHPASCLNPEPRTLTPPHAACL